MPDILDHTSVQDRRVVFAQDLSRQVVSLDLALRQCLDDVPKLLHILLAHLLTEPVGNDNKPILLEMFPPEGLFPEGEPVSVRGVGLWVWDIHKILLYSYYRSWSKFAGMFKYDIFYNILRVANMPGNEWIRAWGCHSLGFRSVLWSYHNHYYFTSGKFVYSLIHCWEFLLNHNLYII